MMELATSSADRSLRTEIPDKVSPRANRLEVIKVNRLSLHQDAVLCLPIYSIAQRPGGARLVAFEMALAKS